MIQWVSLARPPSEVLQTFSTVAGYRQLVVLDGRIRGTCRFPDSPGCGYGREPLPNDSISCWVATNIAPGSTELGLGVYSPPKRSSRSGSSSLSSASEMVSTGVLWLSSGETVVLGKELQHHDGWGTEGCQWTDGTTLGMKASGTQSLDDAVIVYDPIAGAVTMHVKRLSRSFCVTHKALRGNGPLRWHTLVFLRSEFGGCTLDALANLEDQVEDHRSSDDEDDGEDYATDSDDEDEEDDEDDDDDYDEGINEDE